MLRLILLLLIPTFYSCVTSKSINHFSSKNKLLLKKVVNINLFNGKIEIEENVKDKLEKPVYLLYKNDTLLYISNNDRITNNNYIYKIINKSDSTITLTKATMFPRYYNVDTLLVGDDFAIRKTCLYENKEVIQFYLKEYKFLNDSLNINSYRSNRDILSLINYREDLTTIDKKSWETTEMIAYPKQDRKLFFKTYIN